ncbi:MAG: bifunctional diaminohydroxyphosphoribosylaminopyrimidine deaminase/5-amino-6-(5-phosphoribosylamino)uracil reductase RibD [Clostridiales bacterium]|nr:bifunctional diaminohydroxyphosphoribosylaminopyrimidine deaminase/5-amino-6-(5-phosphoribosylamino)uracil reductase RibD [Clostridiales bacterium]
MEQEENYMRYALELAKKGIGYVNPNPLVGAVLVKENQIIGEGYHKKFGGLHAEREAFQNTKESANGATLYVTLEPCCHYGKTPPCTDVIIESGVSKVVIGCSDPNPKVAGKGIEQLKKHGIQVQVGVLRKECEELNRIFFHYIKTKTPYVLMKYAMTLDGKIATVIGESKWITGETAREEVQRTRHQYSAIMVGIGTVIKDDPSLTCRIPNGKNPIRIICDTNLKIPLHSKVVQTAKEVETWIVTCKQERNREKEMVLKEAGCTLLSFSPKKQEKEGENKMGIPLKELMEELGKRGVDSVLLEGGAELNASALKEGIVNRVQAYIAPTLFGGKEGKTPIGGMGVFQVEQGIHLKEVTIKKIGRDYVIEGEVGSCLQES